jgi:hypothetical protein
LKLKGKEYCPGGIKLPPKLYSTLEKPGDYSASRVSLDLNDLSSPLHIVVSHGLIVSGTV